MEMVRQSLVLAIVLSTAHVSTQQRPLNIAHRGASGRYPEHSLPAYTAAIEAGADYIECDMCVTRDLAIVCSHEAWLSRSTNIAEVFPASRMNNYVVIDQARNITDYFSVDFTLAELQSVRRRQAVSYRDPHHDDLHGIVTLEELIAVTQNATRTVGIHLETKDRTWVNSLAILQAANTTFEDLVLGVVHAHGYTGPADPCMLQSFSEESLIYLRPRTQLRLMKTFTALHQTDDAKLAEVAAYSDGVLAQRGLIVTTAGDQIVGRTDFVARAHALGLTVQVWTLKNEARHLAWDYGQDPRREIAEFVAAGVDGILTDFPGTLTSYLDSTGCDVTTVPA